MWYVVVGWAEVERKHMCVFVLVSPLYDTVLGVFLHTQNRELKRVALCTKAQEAEKKRKTRWFVSTPLGRQTLGNKRHSKADAPGATLRLLPR